MLNNPLPILIPYEPDAFWEEIRKIVHNELAKLDLSRPSATSESEVPGLTYKPLYNMNEICDFFEISKPTVYDWIKNGILKPMKIQSRVYFLYQDVQLLLKSGAK
ncbi:MAG TPA: helix-turn-helix domain-containing protein [Puia sp.]|jgi:predicted DNA-binding transcriptional regulator AlpA